MTPSGLADTTISKLVVLICTRNRPDFLGDLLVSLTNQTHSPAKVFVVDSSTDSKTQELIRELSRQGSLDLHYVKSEAGLPHQRNVGIDQIIASGFSPNTAVSFLDDDVQVEDNYLEKVQRIFEKYPDVKFVGGYARGAESEPDNPARRLALLSELEGAGKVLKSGICIAARPRNELEEVTWVPGHSMNAKLEIFSQTLFNPAPRIYGEDVEFQLRLGSAHRIYSSNALPVLHKQAPSNRDQLADLEAYSDGFRWSLARRKLGGVRKWAVLWATLCMALALLGKGVVLRQPDAMQRLKGHVTFLVRVLARRETEQLIR
ncbi:MAG: hypothetical protein RIQ31_100 [Actinomycetota bacterium]|jgi:GT2 family glycosyltransferase